MLNLWPSRRRAFIIASMLAGLALALGVVTGAAVLNAAPSHPSEAAEDDSTAGVVSGSSQPAPAVPASMPEDLPATAESADCLTAHTSQLTPTGVAAENARTGDASWKKAIQPRSGAVMAYADQTSFRCGDVVAIHASGRAGTVRARVLRFGWYAGAGAREVSDMGSCQVTSLPLGNQSGPTRAVRPNWPECLHFTIPAQWPPGFYAVVLDNAADRSSSLVPFVLASGGVRTPLLYWASNLTWNAYNSPGGISLYVGPGTSKKDKAAHRSYEATFGRPMAGAGSSQILQYELPLVQLLERSNRVMGWTTDTEVDARPSQLLGHNGILIPGHSEYWTTRMYDAAEVARDKGVNLAFLGANEVYWKTRLVRDGNNGPVSSIVYKNSPDPAPDTDPQAHTTLWSSPILNRDPVRISGSQFAAVGVYGPSRVMRANSWVFHGTRLKDGDLIQGAIGGEADSASQSGLLPGAPTNVEVLLEGTFKGTTGHLADRTASTNYYSAPSGAGVFNAGSTMWTCAAMNMCSFPVPDKEAQSLTTITNNVIDAFTQPQAGRTHPSVRTDLLPSAALLKLIPPDAVATTVMPKPWEQAKPSPSGKSPSQQ